MPELPEVETTVNEIKPHVVGKKIKSVETPGESSIACPPAAEFREELKGRTITDGYRRGKHLIFPLDNGKYLLVHLRMTGALLAKKNSDEPDKFVRVIIRFGDGTAVHFRDVRRFGRMWLVESAEEVTGDLGIEPLSEAFTAEALANMLKGRTTPVKSMLLNQNLIAGIGNMYADEALHAAAIHPLQPAGNLTPKQIKKLHQSIREVLEQGIRNNGASTDTYFRPSGDKGAAHLAFKVAHRKGETCPVCSCGIERIVVGQRGTYYCPKCQKLH